MSRLILVLVLVPGAALPAADLPPPATVDEVHRLLELAHRSLDRGELEAAGEHLRAAQELAPDSPFPAYELACLAATRGRRAEALQWLREAAARGLVGAAQVQQDRRLRPLATDPALPAVLAQVRASERAQAAALRPLYRPELPALPGNDLVAIQAALEQEIEALTPATTLLPPLVALRQHADLVSRHLTALAQYADRTPPPPDQAAALRRQLLAHDHLVQQVEGSLQSDGPALARLAAAYLEVAPAGAGAREARLIQARVELEGGAPGERRAARETLLELAGRTDDLTVAGTALVELVDHLLRTGAERDQIRPLVTRLEPLRERDPAVAAVAEQRLGLLHLRLEGLPEFSARDLEGHRITRATLRGQVTLVEVWASWCPPCVAAIPRLVELEAAYHDRGFRVVGICLDQDLSAGELRTWCEDRSMTWPQILADEGWESPLVHTLGLSRVPCSLLVDQSGRVLETEARGDRLAALLSQLLPE
jgi:thiol-disulfide isomerase/thioredoxin